VITRRDFIRNVGMLGLTGMQPLTWLPDHLHSASATQASTLDPNTLAKFVDALPLPVRAQSQGLRSRPADSKIHLPYFRMIMQQTQGKVHRDLKPTTWWACGGAVPGPTIDVERGTEILVDWVNQLPAKHFLPIDHRIHGAEPTMPEVRSVMHLHGARTRPESDGYPEDWIRPGETALYHYPNDQDACTLWYHDHTLGINRLNVYAGLFGMFLVRDAQAKALNLPSGAYEIPLTIFDRMLSPQGELLYPTSPDPESPWVPEVFGNAILINGKLFPYLDVQPRKYRFRVLNASNSRFYNLSLSNQAPFHQIGTEQGFLNAPYPTPTLVLAPGERADLVIDFKDHAGERLVLLSGAIELLQFRVSSAKVEDESSLPSQLRSFSRIPEAQATKTRILTIDEYQNQVSEPVLMLLNGTHWNMPITEKPALNSTEIWTFVNPTDDSHPIHLHLVRFQILDRRRYEPWQYQSSGRLVFTGPPVPPDPSEDGWKDTVRVEPRMVTRIVVPFQGYPGRYVWHCHILEHEDNEMMRPFEVVATDSPVQNQT